MTVSTARNDLILKIIKEIKKVIVGQDELILRIIVALLSKGHVLLEGVPGLAKTLALQTLAETIDAKFNRIQFTPDLLPADISGTKVFNQKTMEFEVVKGPIFANFVLADEINRAPAKVQSALLEAMQERQVTIGEHTFKLPELFMVMATQNPIESEGTYPLPEAQVDRFLMKVKVTYPSKDEELTILDRMGSNFKTPTPDRVATVEDILEIQREVDEVYVDDKLKRYIVDIVFATRFPDKYGLSELKPLIDWGASPRASLSLFRASKALAYIRSRNYVLPEDIKELAFDILRHRIILSYEAFAQGVSQEEVIEQILKKIKVP